MTKEPPRITFDPLDQMYLADPAATISFLHECGPVAYDPQLKMWIISGYKEISSILLDPHRFSSAGISQNPVHQLCPDALEILQSYDAGKNLTVSSLDPPAHSRLRSPIVKAFKAKSLRDLEENIIRDADSLVEIIARKPKFDFVREFAHPLPARTIFSLIGFPAEDYEMINDWCSQRLALTWGKLPPAHQIKAAIDLNSYRKYCANFVQRRLLNRTDDFTSQLILIHESDPEILSHRDITAIICSLSFAGHETTTKLISNTLLRLLRENPYGAPKFHSDEASEIRLLEEVIRLETSLTSWQRTATQDVEIDGIDIPANSRILLMLGAAGRDPSHMSDPHVFDPRRDASKKHLAFGKGIHSCPGAPLARLQTRVSIRALRNHIPFLRITDSRDIPYSANISFRGPTQLWMEWNRPNSQTSTN